MTNNEKALELVQKCLDDWPFAATRVDDIMNRLKQVKVLLKEQEAVKPKSKVRHGANAQIQHFCGNCNSMLHGKPKFCSECGNRIEWESR